MKKTIGIFLIIVSVVLVMWLITNAIIANYRYDRDVESYYTLSVQASTAEKKLEYINIFENKIIENNLITGYGAIIFKKPKNDAFHQYEILKTIKERLISINSVNISSFEYQQAMYEMSRIELAVSSAETYDHINIYIFEQRYYLLNNIFAHMSIFMFIFFILSIVFMIGFLLYMCKDY